MRLNKKGFAFSTMLYGTAALLAVVLYVVLNITKSSSDETYYYGEEILKSLNECVTEEVSLENCYASGGSCDKTSYYACLGVSDNPGETKGVIISEKLKEDMETSGLVVDQNSSKRYIYQGSIVKNYIEYAGKTFRILSIEPGGSLKLVDIESNINMAWDNNSNSEFNDSSLYNYLNGSYLSTLNDKSKIVIGSWNKAYLYPPTGSSNYNLHTLVEDENKNYESTKIKDTTAGMLLLSDYINASTNQECKNDILNASSCSSWLSDYKGWVIDVDAIKSTDETGYAYFMDSGNKINNDITSSLKNVYPVIFLNKNSVIISGDGTEASPYKIR